MTPDENGFAVRFDNRIKYAIAACEVQVDALNDRAIAGAARRRNEP